MESTAMQAAQHVGNPIAVSGVVTSQMPSHNMSMFDLFLSAEPLVKAIMFALIIASIWSWAIIIVKVLRLYRANRSATIFEEAFWSGGSLDDLFDRIHSRVNDPMSAIFCAAMREWRRSVSKGTIRGTLEQRIERVMQVTLGREMEELEKRMTFLASLGSNGMIVGLFGTVIGIMNSFENIAAQQNTNLAVVAPGIAEALFATAIGLIAAIPAAIAFNKISSDLNRFANRLDTFCTEFGSIISRQLEENA